MTHQHHRILVWHRLWKLSVFALMVLAIDFSPGQVLAHADIVDRVADLDRAIAQRPNEWALYLKRGELHRLDQNWAAALEDYGRAERIATELPDIHFYRGRMWYEAGEPEAARAALDRFLTLRPNHVGAQITRSRVLAELGDYLAGAKDLTRAIDVSKTPTPELYLERARHLAAAGPSYVSQALSGLDEAIALLGPLVTLIKYAVELEPPERRLRTKPRFVWNTTGLGGKTGCSSEVNGGSGTEPAEARVSSSIERP